MNLAQPEANSAKHLQLVRNLAKAAAMVLESTGFDNLR
jgi:hypothetical protein